MSIRQDVFGLESVYLLQTNGQWSIKDDVWLVASPRYVNWTHGYFGGGLLPGTTSTVTRIDYSNDTSTGSLKGPLSLARYYLAATGNSSYGWFGGGTPAITSVVDRIDYSNDTATASPKGPLSVARTEIAATSAAANGLPQ